MKWTRRAYTLGILRSAAFAAGGALAGACGSSTGGEPTGQPTLRRGTELLVLHNPFATAVDAWFVSTVNQWAEPLGLKVNVQFLTSTAEREKITALAAAGTPADAIKVWGGLPGVIHAQALAFLQYTQNLDPLVKRDKYDLSDFTKDWIDLLRFRGSVYGLPPGFPAGLNVHCMFLNKTAFREVGLPLPTGDWGAQGWDWAEFLTAAQKTVRRDAAGQVARYGCYVLRTGWGGVWPWVHSNGGLTVNKDSTECVLTQAPAVEALQFLQDTVQRHGVGIPPDGLGGLSDQANFQQGRVAILGGGVGFASTSNYRRTIPPSSFEWDVVPYPRSKRGRFTLYHAVGMSIGQGTKNVEEAWALLKFLATKEATSPEAYLTSARRSVQQMAPEFTDPNIAQKNVKALVQTLGGHGHVEPEVPTDNWVDARNLLDNNLKTLWDGSKAPMAWATEMKPQVENILRQGKKLV